MIDLFYDDNYDDDDDDFLYKYMNAFITFSVCIILSLFPICIFLLTELGRF